MNTASKIFELDGLLEQVKVWKHNNQKIVFSNGCFDIVHLGHIDYLEKARNLGDKLIIGLNTDKSVKRLKGNTRPVVSEYPRARLMASLAFVDAITFFEEDTPLNLIKQIMPNILTKGADYSVENIVGAKEVLANGGKVETIELVAGYSTSNIIKKIKEI